MNLLMVDLPDSPTKSGSQLVQSAHERMMSKNPTARTKDRRMTAAHSQPLDKYQDVRSLFSPAAIAVCNGNVQLPMRPSTVLYIR